MKVLFFLRDISDCGGIQQTTCNLFSSLRNYDKNIEIVGISIYNKQQSPFFKISQDIKLISLFEEKIDIYKSISKIKKRLCKKLNSISYDLLVLQGIEYSLYLNNSIWKKKNVIACEHGYYGFGHFFGFHWRGVRKALLKASSIVTLTKLDADEYKKRNIRKIPIFSIYNQYDSSLKKTVSYNANSKTIVSCGSLIPLKRFDVLIKIAKIVLEKNKDWTWELYGDGVLKNQLLDMAKKEQINDRFIIMGYEFDKSVIYGNKAFFVMTSEFEGFGMVLIEAMQHSLPIMSFDIKFGPKEIVENGLNGFLINDDDYISFANCISDLINNKNQRLEMSNYTNVSLQRFSPEQITSNWMIVFKTILKIQK